MDQEMRPLPEQENLLNYKVQGGSEVDEVPLSAKIFFAKSLSFYNSLFDQTFLLNSFYSSVSVDQKKIIVDKFLKLKIVLIF